MQQFVFGITFSSAQGLLPVGQLEVTPGSSQSSEDHAVLGLKLEQSARSLKPSLGSVIPALGLDSDRDPFFLSYMLTLPRAKGLTQQRAG